MTSHSLPGTRDRDPVSADTAFQDHITALYLRSELRLKAEDHDVTLTWVSGWRSAESYVISREARVPEIGLDHPYSDYLIGLHEIGHVAFPNAPDYESAGHFAHLAREGLAWAWAVDHALPCPREDWDRVLKASLLGHYAYIAPALVSALAPALAPDPGTPDTDTETS